MLAKSLRESQKQEVTASGELVGNMYYMAPERTADKEVDGRADLYSLPERAADVILRTTT